MQTIPETFTCGDCVYYLGCRIMDMKYSTKKCPNWSQEECPKDQFVLNPNWKDVRAERDYNRNKHMSLVKRQKKNKKKKKRR